MDITRLTDAAKKLGWVRVAIILAVLLPVLDVARYLVYPSVSVLAKQDPKLTAMMRYRQGQWDDKGRKVKIRQNWVSLSAVSPYMVKAVLIAEDDKFWAHEGFDFEAMEKALEKDISKLEFHAGGSTISQQLAKNLFLSPSKNPVRKLKEAILTWRIERSLSKKRILELYLNIAEWGDGIYGVDAAARHYYGIPASALGPDQAARMAAVLPGPLRYSPTGQSRYVDNRARIIHGIMVRRGIVLPVYEEVIAHEEEQPAQSPEDVPEPVMGNVTGVAPVPAFANITTGG